MTLQETWTNCTMPLEIKNGQFYWFNIGGEAHLVKIICIGEKDLVYQLYEQGFWRWKPTTLILMTLIKVFTENTIRDYSK